MKKTLLENDLLRVKMDGDMWYVGTLRDNMQEGLYGFGRTKAAALRDLANAVERAEPQPAEGEGAAERVLRAAMQEIEELLRPGTEWDSTMCEIIYAKVQGALAAVKQP
jgi:hypothetical protein